MSTSRLPKPMPMLDALMLLIETRAGQKSDVPSAQEIMNEGLNCLLFVLAHSAIEPPSAIPDVIARLTTALNARLAWSNERDQSEMRIKIHYETTLASLTAQLKIEAAHQKKLQTMRDGPNCPKCNFTMTPSGNPGVIAFICRNCNP